MGDAPYRSTHSYTDGCAEKFTTIGLVHAPYLLLISIRRVEPPQRIEQSFQVRSTY